MKKTELTILAILLITLGIGYHFHFNSFNQSAPKNKDKRPEKREGKIKKDNLDTEILDKKNEINKSNKFLEQKESEITTPPPLEGPTDQPATESELTVEGIIEETNSHRIENGLNKLSADPKLKQAAEIKVNDMFENQYFAHESPTGEVPKNLAEKAGYDYLLIGENLALGNYKNDKTLVQAWMDSPGHRKNILNDKYTEIGVAIKKDDYQGRNIWMAVQEFGRPSSDCEKPDDSLKAKIQTKRENLKELEDQLEIKREEIEETRKRNEYNKKVKNYRNLIEEYNSLLEEIKKLTSKYNKQVKSYNNCVK